MRRALRLQVTTEQPVQIGIASNKARAAEETPYRAHNI
jgi:hypothetical protein